MHKNLQPSLSSVFNDLFLSETNERRNRPYQKYKNCFYDFDDFRSCIVDLYIRFRTKITEDPTIQEIYTNKNYIYKSFERTAFKNNEKVNNLPFVDLYDAVDFEKLINSGSTIHDESCNILEFILEWFNKSGLNHREIALMLDKHQHSLTHEQIASKYNMSISNVKHVISQAKTKMKNPVAVNSA